MTRPSGSCSTRAPTAVSTSSRAWSRSVSCPRMWAIPVNRDGPSARAARAARTGASSPTSPRSATSGRIVPEPDTCSPSDVRVTSAPISASSRSSWAPGCVVTSGQSRTVTEPPVTRAAARKGAALERSGSTTTSRAPTGPGVTRQPRSAALTSTPCARRVVTVMSTCGIEGTPPVRERSRPSSKRAPESSSPETICEDSPASTTTAPPCTWPVPCTVKGALPRPPSSTSTPRSRRAPRRPALGRSRNRGSPSRRIGPVARAASGGRNRRTVPDSPASTSAGPCRGRGVTNQSGWVGEPSSSIRTPRDRRPAAISSESRARSGRTSRLGPSAIAARISSRAVIDLEPGSATTAATGAVRCGVVQTGVTTYILPGQRRRTAYASRSAGLRLLGLLRRENARQLAVGELEHAQFGQFPPVPGALHTAEGQLGRGAGGLVDEDHPGLDPVGHGPRAVEVAAEHSRAEAVVGAVGQCDGLVLVRHLVDDGGGAEQLLVVGPHLGRDAGEQGGLDEGALVVRTPAAGQHRGALVDGVLDLRVQVLSGALRGQGGQRRRRVGGVTRGEGGERLLEAGHEVVVDVLGDDDPLGGDAGLAAVLHPSRGGRLDGPPEVLGVEHDERVAAAQLEDRLLQVAPGDLGDARAGLLTAGQRDALDVRVGDDLLDVGDAKEDVGVDALGGAGVAEQLLQRERALRVQLGVLEQDGVAQNQVGSGHTDHLVEGVVPRLDRQDDAERLVLDDGLALHHVDAPGFQEPRAVRGVVLEDRRREHDLAGRLLDALAHLSGDQRGVLVAALVHQLRGPADDGGALLGRELPPLLEGGVRPLDDAVDLTRLEERELLFLLPGVGVDRRVGPGSGVAGGLGLLGGRVLGGGHAVILVSRQRCPSSPTPARPATHRRPGVSPRTYSSDPQSPRGGRGSCVVAMPPAAVPRTSSSSSRPSSPRGSRRWRPTTTSRRPRTCTSSATRRSATPRGCPPVAATGSSGRCVGAWSPPGRRMPRWATASSTPGSSRSPRSRPSARPPPRAGAWSRPMAGTSGPSGWTRRASSLITSPPGTGRCWPSPDSGRCGGAARTGCTPARS